jgi:cysteine desulfurase
MRVYLDNAATTPMDPAVLDSMIPYYTGIFGNPSSTHTHGRIAKAAVESSRKKIAEILNVTPSSIYFNSGGTEGDNISIRGLIQTFDIKHVISTRIEHHAVLHTLEAYKKEQPVRISYLDLDERGNIDFDQLEELLKRNPNSLVSLMHANNEIGNLLDLARTGNLCREFGAYFHSDTVQSIGKYPFDLKTLPVHAIVASAHKFHGPKGIGFLYLNTSKKIRPLIYGGGQEREIRPGTENVAGIVGLAKAFELAYTDLEKKKEYIVELKIKMIQELKKYFPGISFNGTSDMLGESLYTVLSVNLPPSEKQDMVLFKLDLNNISVSGGSACASGALKGSHVINEIRKGTEVMPLRFSFSRFNTPLEVDFVVQALERIVRQVPLTRE